MKNKKFVNIILIAAILGIWGVIVSHIIDYYFSGSQEIQIESNIEDEPEDMENIPTLNTNSNITYQNLNRDPFAPLSAIVMDREEKKNQNEEENNFLKPFTYELQGIMIDGNSRIAVITDLSDNTTHFLTEGDIHNALKIIKISQAQVDITFDGENDVLVME